MRTEDHFLIRTPDRCTGIGQLGEFERTNDLTTAREKPIVTSSLTVVETTHKGLYHVGEKSSKVDSASDRAPA